MKYAITALVLSAMNLFMSIEAVAQQSDLELKPQPSPVVVTGSVRVPAARPGQGPNKALLSQRAAAAAAAVFPKTQVQQAPIAIQVPLLNAEEIAARNAIARGGAQAWLNVQAISLNGKLDAGRERVEGGNIPTSKSPIRGAERLLVMAQSAAEEKKPTNIFQLPFKLELSRPQQLRLEIAFDGDTAIQVFDGKQGWKVRPFLGRREVESFTAEETQIAASELELDGPLINHVAKGIVVAAEGAELVEGHKAYRMKFTLPSGESRRIWIDAQTFLDLKIEDPARRFDGKMRPVTTYFKDYRSVEGLQIAHMLETRVQGNSQVERVLIDQVKINPSKLGGRYAKPE